MAVATGFDRLGLRHASLLAEAGQGVVFAEEGDHRTSRAPFAHQGGRNIRDILRDPEALMAQLGQMFGGGARLGVANLGRRPDLVAQCDEARLDRVDAPPNVTPVIHLAKP